MHLTALNVSYAIAGDVGHDGHQMGVDLVLPDCACIHPA